MYVENKSKSNCVQTIKFQAHLCTNNAQTFGTKEMCKYKFGETVKMDPNLYRLFFFFGHTYINFLIDDIKFQKHRNIFLLYYEIHL